LFIFVIIYFCHSERSEESPDLKIAFYRWRFLAALGMTGLPNDNAEKLRKKPLTP